MKDLIFYIIAAIVFIFAFGVAFFYDPKSRKP